MYNVYVQTPDKQVIRKKGEEIVLTVQTKATYAKAHSIVTASDHALQRLSYNGTF